jgi:hypothetical protein
MTHELKTWPEYFWAIRSGLKRFEVRKNDRGFAVMDKLLLREYDPRSEKYTGMEIEVVVLYKLDGYQFGIEPGYCVLSIDITGGNAIPMNG